MPNNPLKNYVRDLFYGEILSERIVEYPVIFAHIAQAVKDSAAVLDVGCYYSNLPIQLASMGYKVTGVDLQDYSLTHPNFKFVQGDIRDLSFSSQFDVATAISTLEHIGLAYYLDYEQASGDRVSVAAIRNLLKPKGKILITVPYGVQSQNKSFRTYDWDSLAKLLQGFKIKHSLFYQSRNNKWLPTTRRLASRIKNTGKVKCFVFILGEKVND